MSDFKDPGSKHYAFLQCDILVVGQCASFAHLVECVEEARRFKRPYLTLRCNPPAGGRWEPFELTEGTK